MKVAILIFFLIHSSRGSALCLPDSLGPKMNDGFEMDVLEREAQNFERSVVPSIPGELDLVVQFLPLNPRVNAEILKTDKELIIEVMGGMLRHPKMSENSLKLLLCHELGHFKGGPPLKMRGGWSSTEGQADYFSGLTCARQLGMDEQSFLLGAQELTSIYAEVMKESRPRLDQCDQRRVERINFGYPSVQCRLDTIVAGWRGAERPLCWFTN